jgi:hypothetical protein
MQCFSVSLRNLAIRTCATTAAPLIGASPETPCRLCSRKGSSRTARSIDPLKNSFRTWLTAVPAGIPMAPFVFRPGCHRESNVVTIQNVGEASEWACRAGSFVLGQAYRDTPHVGLYTPSSLGQPSDSLVNRDCELSPDKDENRDIGYLKV